MTFDANVDHDEAIAKWRGFDAEGIGGNITIGTWKHRIRQLERDGNYMFRELILPEKYPTPPPPTAEEMAQSAERGLAMGIPGPSGYVHPCDDDDYGHWEDKSTGLVNRAVNASSLVGKPVPERDWHVPDFIPAENITLLYADGGTGKSLVALQLAVATATGRLWFGRPVKHGRVLFMTAEDSQKELHIRLADIERECAIPLAEMGALALVSYSDDNMILAALTQGKLGQTALYDEIDEVVAETRPALLILDTAADVFDGDEIKRAQVRQFVGMLRRLAFRHGLTIVLLAHPSVAGMNTGTGTSGSTAWSNSVRSRLYLVNVDDEPTGDARVLRGMKSNYGKKGLEINLRYRRGVFVPEAAAMDGDPLVKQAMVDSVFLELVGKYADQGRHVSCKTGTNYGPKKFESDPLVKGRRISKADLEAAMNRLLDDRRIRNEQYGPKSDNTSHLVVSFNAPPAPVIETPAAPPNASKRLQAPLHSTPL
jgi:RecA-family ATPase